MESEGSRPYSQQQVTSPNAQADKSESQASRLNTDLNVNLSYDTIRWENHEGTYCHVSELYEHPTVFMLPSVMGVQVNNYWFWACSDLCLIWKCHGTAHSCYSNSWHTVVQQSLAHSCIKSLAHSCTTILGTQLNYNYWHTAVLQSLAHSCITILGTQLYYNSWHTALLQFLREVNRTAFRESGSGNKPLFFSTNMSGDISLYLQDGVDVQTTWPLTWWWWMQLR
jgi:hypothetical protein